jgi:hypothetical protein
MCQPSPLYAASPAMQLLEPWMQARLPKVVDPTARAHIIQLAAGIFERQSALVATIATASAFQANTDSSNETLLRRILRDERLFLESVYYPFIQHLLNEMAPSELYLTIDESSHLSDFDIFGVGLATDGLSIPLGWILYATDEAWAEDARSLLATLADYLPKTAHIIVLADRIHTGEPFLSCLDDLGWDYVFRASADTQIETARGWKTLRSLALRPRQGRFFQHVRIWKGGQRRTNVRERKAAAQGLSTRRLVSGLKLARHARTVCRIRVSVVARVWLSRHKERLIRLGTRTDCRFRASECLANRDQLCALGALVARSSPRTSAGVEIDHHDTPAATQKHHSGWDQRLYKREQARPGFELYDTTKTTE